MTPSAWRVTAGPPASPADRSAARLTRELLADELPQARRAAQAWSHGLAGLFVGLLGFGLLKGRTDVGELDTAYGVAAGAGLLLALACGAAGALLLLRAAHGAPRLRRFPPAVLGALLEAGDHLETLRAVRALRRGIALTLACGAALVGSVGLTWYGPAKDAPAVLVRTPSGSVCGRDPEVAGQRLTLKTDTGSVTVNLSQVRSLAAMDACPAAGSGG